MQEMVIYGVSFDMVGKQPIVLLKAVDTNKFLPIWIGHPEAAAILMKLQGGGIGRRLMEDLIAKAERPLLVGTWAAATWAIRFYERNGFELVTREEKDRLLQTYWDIPARQVEASVVLAHRPAAHRGYA